jgi:hypothetical protein
MGTKASVPTRIIPLWFWLDALRGAFNVLKQGWAYNGFQPHKEMTQ